MSHRENPSHLSSLNINGMDKILESLQYSGSETAPQQHLIKTSDRVQTKPE